MVFSWSSGNTRSLQKCCRHSLRIEAGVLEQLIPLDLAIRKYLIIHSSFTRYSKSIGGCMRDYNCASTLFERNSMTCAESKVVCSFSVKMWGNVYFQTSLLSIFFLLFPFLGNVYFGFLPSLLHLLLSFFMHPILLLLLLLWVSPSPHTHFHFLIILPIVSLSSSL